MKYLIGVEGWRKNIGLLVFFITVMLNVTWSQSKLDSLLLDVDQAKTEKEKAKGYYYLAEFYIYQDNQKTIQYAKEGLEITPKCECDKIEYFLLNLLAWAEAEINNWAGSEFVAQKILQNQQDYGVEEAKMEALRILGYINSQQFNYEKSLEFYDQSLKEAQKKNSASDLGAAYSDIGRIYHQQNDSSNAKKFYELALNELKKEGADQFFLANVTSNYSQLLKNPRAKMALIDSCIVIYKALDVSEYLASELRNKGIVYHDLEEYTKAMDEYRKAISVLSENSLEKEYTFAQMVPTYMELGKLDSALYYGEMALEKISNANGEVYSIKRLLVNLTRGYLIKRNFKKVSSYFERSLVITDSIYSEEKIAKVVEFNARYEHEQKEAQILTQQLEIARQKNTQNRMLFGGLFVLLVGGMIFVLFTYKSQRNKQKTKLALEFEKAKAEKLRELDQMKSNFFTNLSHELRTPLTLIIGPVKHILENLSDQKMKPDLELIQSNSKKILSMVNEILDLSKLESGKLILYEQKVNLYQLVKRIYYSFQSMAQIRNVELKFNYQIEKGLQVLTDVGKFEKILNNLIINAIKYSKKGDQVLMTVQKDLDHLQIIITDTGSGIHPDDIDKVFNRFYQSSKEEAPIQGGTGIGLALVKELTKLFGGDLKVESQLGKGSSFILDMPLKELGVIQIRDKEFGSGEEEVQADDSHATYVPFLLDGKRARILIVEDNPEMSRYLEGILSPYYQCKFARDGIEGLKLVQKESFDLITSDVMMPFMDGFKFREKVNSIPRLKFTPFILLTARILEEDKLYGLNLGVDDYITKPFNANELLARINNLLANKVERQNWLKENKVEVDFKVNLDSADSEILKRAERTVIRNIDNTDFKVKDLALQLNYGERQLQRIIRKLTGLSPVKFILEIRLQKAYQMLTRGQFLSVSEVRNEIGIESASYFTAKFKERFGCNPVDMLK